MGEGGGGGCCSLWRSCPYRVGHTFRHRFGRDPPLVWESEILLSSPPLFSFSFVSTRTIRVRVKKNRTHAEYGLLVE